MTIGRKGLDLTELVTDHVEPAGPHLLRKLLRTFVQALTSADLDATCGPECGPFSAAVANLGLGTSGLGIWAGRIGLALPRAGIWGCTPRPTSSPTGRWPQRSETGTSALGPSTRCRWLEPSSEANSASWGGLPNSTHDALAVGVATLDEVLRRRARRAV
jgi:hypothetical protein